MFHVILGALLIGVKDTKDKRSYAGVKATERRVEFYSEGFKQLREYEEVAKERIHSAMRSGKDDHEACQWFGEFLGLQEEAKFEINKHKEEEEPTKVAKKLFNEISKKQEEYQQEGLLGFVRKKVERGVATGCEKSA